MSKFLMVFRGSLAEEMAYPPEKMQAYMQEWMTWIEAMKNQNIYLEGEPLQPNGCTISGADKVITDGPYAEAKDLVGGYVLISADNLDNAKREALNCPIYQANGSVEVREIMLMDKHTPP